MFRRRFIIMTALLCAVLTATAQERKIQNKPYIDLRPMHFASRISTCARCTLASS